MAYYENLKLSAEAQRFLQTSVLTRKQLSLPRGIFYLGIEVEQTLPYKIYQELSQQVEYLTPYPVVMEIRAKQNGLNYLDIHHYLHAVIQNDQTLTCFNECQSKLEADHLLLTSHHLPTIQTMSAKVDSLMESLAQCGCPIHIDVRYVEKVVKVEVESVVLDASSAPREMSEPSSAKKNYRNATKPRAFKIKDLQEEEKKVVVVGKVFSIESMTTRTGSIIETFGIYDREDALSCKRILRTVPQDEDLLLEGQSVRLGGDFQYDEFAKRLIFMVRSWEHIDDIFKRDDSAPEKRVEFHAHTNFSEMDGVVSVEQMIGQAIAWHHPGLAITDHSVVQTFPKAYRTLEKYRQKQPDLDFKLVYGCEMMLVDDTLTIVSNPQQQLLAQATYVVFDLETTGLSTRYDHIIEFGAVKIKQGAIIDRLQLFIKPPVKLRAFISEKTSIRDDMLRQSAPIEQAIVKMMDFIGDSVLVAHNASFDTGFLRAALAKAGLPDLTNTYIDTLDLSRALFKNRKGYRLGNIARSYKITYDEEVAHRADYDAEVLSDVFAALLREPQVKQLTLVSELQSLSDEDAFKKVMKSHICVLAKDQIGLKSLYELVSLSHTKYLSYTDKASGKNEATGAEPRIIRSELIAHRDHLLLGSACFNGEIFELAANRSQAELEAAMEFYDYIELQPLGNYQPLIDREAIESMDHLKVVLRNIYDTAQKLGKLVIASGDSHYLHPHEKILRDIYVNSPGIGGVRHPLYIYDDRKRMSSTIPDQHFKTTTEMLADFDAFDPELSQALVVDNPQRLLAQIEEVIPVKDKLYTPSIEGSDEKLVEICMRTAHATYGEVLPELVEQRLHRELDSIIKHGFGVIYYIAHLLVKKSLDDGYIVGSRGSVGSSFVATMANITEVNPLVPHYSCPKCQHSEFFEHGEILSGFDLPDKICPQCGTLMHGDGQNIPFETFLGFEADKVPDIDLNFSGDYQEFAHAYTKVVFGEDYVYRAGTISTVAHATAYGYVKGYYENKGITEAIKPAWLDRLAMGAEGVKRTTGQHPGGIIVIPADMDVHDFTPIQYPANNPYADWRTTHFEFADIHDNVLKLDILGHVDPTATKMLEQMTNVSARSVNFTDEKVISLFSSIDALNIDKRTYTEDIGAVGLPEFGTRNTRRMLEKTKPTSFAELVQISGLAHGTDVWANNAEVLISQEHKALLDVIGCRDDIMTYLVGKALPSKLSFDIMESVRKGKGLKEEWIVLMKEKGVPDWYIESCLKIKYMFPKAHAVAYVTSAMRIAWYKIYRPAAYYAVFFTLRVEVWEIETLVKGAFAISERLNDITNRLNRRDLINQVSNKEKQLVDTLEVAWEMCLRGYRFSPIDLNKSLDTQFSVDHDDPQVIIPPFSVVDGLGGNVAKSIVAARLDAPFLSKKDLMARTSLSQTLVKKLEEYHVLDDLDDDNQLSLF